MLMQSLLHHIEVQKSIPKKAMNLWDMLYLQKRDSPKLYYIYYKSILINKYIFARPFKLTKAYLIASKLLKITRNLRACLVKGDESIDLIILHYYWNNDSSLWICIVGDFTLILMNIAEKNRVRCPNLLKWGFLNLIGVVGSENPNKWRFSFIQIIGNLQLPNMDLL